MKGEDLAETTFFALVKSDPDIHGLGVQEVVDQALHVKGELVKILSDIADWKVTQDYKAKRINDETQNRRV